MKRKETFLLAAGVCATALLAFLPGCNSDAADDTALEPTRDERIRSLANAACDRYEDTDAGCPGFGTGDDQRYETKGDCVRDFESRGSTLWPNERCGQGQIDNARFESCVDRAENFACSTGLQNISDAISALNECNADTVCIDPPK